MLRELGHRPEADPRLRRPESADRWTWMILAAHAGSASRGR
ncbi:hypothetical protein OG320_08785 [Microbispora sp. NBC_01189]|nr:hypothetical protein OG320_08785 [Microbispora sp. NBC_01189]